MSTRKRLRVGIIHVSQTKGKNLLVVSPVCQQKKIFLAKLCKCAKKLTSSPDYTRPPVNIPDNAFFIMRSIPLKITIIHFNMQFATLKTSRKPRRVNFRKDFWNCYQRALDSETKTTMTTRFSQYQVVLTLESASFWRENVVAVVILLRV